MRSPRAAVPLITHRNRSPLTIAKRNAVHSRRAPVLAAILAAVVVGLLLSVSELQAVGSGPRAEVGL